MTTESRLPKTGPGVVLSGTLHIHVAFDWGEEIKLDHARRLVPAETHVLSRRRRTPTSIAYRPSPLRIRLPAVALTFPEEWEHSIQRKLEVIEGVYQVVADQASHYRTEFLEIVVIGLILIEIVLALVQH